MNNVLFTKSSFVKRNFLITEDDYVEDASMHF